MIDQETALDAVRHIQRRMKQFDHGRQDPTEVLDVIDAEDSAPVEAVAANTAAVTAKNFWHHPDTHPIALDLMLLRRYGPQFLEWEAETLRRAVSEDFHSSNLSEVNLTKLQAVKALHLVDTFWEDWEVFLWCTMSLNGIFPDFSVLQAPTVPQCLLAIDTANHLRDDMPWGEEIKAFLEVSFRHDGLLVALAPIDFIKIARDPDLADFQGIEARWPKVRASRRAPGAETPEDEQLRRMLAAHESLEENRERLRHQLSLVAHA